MVDHPEELLSITEVCRFFGGAQHPVHPSTIYRWVREGRIPPSIRVGPMTLRWRRGDLQKALSAIGERHE